MLSASKQACHSRQAGDQLLFASSLATLRKLSYMLQNGSELGYVLDGKESSSWLGRKLRRA